MDCRASLAETEVFSRHDEAVDSDRCGQFNRVDSG